MIKIKTAAEQIQPEKNNPERLTMTHVVLVFLALFLGGTVVFSFLLDLVGLPVRFWSVGPLLILLLGGTYWVFRQGANRRKIEFRAAPELALFLLVVMGVLGYLLWLGRPSLLPVGTTVDAVHQYGLAHYIYETGKLPIHALEQRANLQDGLEYPPAFVTVVALFAGVSSVDVVYLLYPLAALWLALACGTTFALASFLLKGYTGRLPLAALAATLALIPYGYTFGSITAQNYFAMVLAELFLLLSLYFLLVWKEEPRPALAFFFWLTLAALVITYPTWALIPAIAFGVVALFGVKLTRRIRLSYLAGVFSPLALLTGLFLKDRLETGLGTVANEGDVLLPDLGRYGWPIVALAMVGLILALRKKGAEPLALYAGLLFGEGLAFYLLKNLFDKASYYSIYKLFYPATFLFALLAVLGLAELLQYFGGLFKSGKARLTLLQSAWLGGVIFGLTLGATWLAHPEPTRAYPAITDDMVRVGEWAAQNLALEEYSVGYSLPFGTPTYWLQVGFFQQRQGNRAKILITGEPITFEQWFYNPQSEKYLFTDDLGRVNLDERLNLLYRSGSVGMLTRTPAYDNSRTLRQSTVIVYRAELNEERIKLTAEATFSADPGHWMRLGLALEPEQGGPPVFEDATPAEPNRERKEYLGINLVLPTLKTVELYTNDIFPPVKKFNPLAPGRYAAYLQLYKNEILVERRKLFTFSYDQNITFDPAQRIQLGQFLFDGPLSPNLVLPATRLDFGQDLPQLADYELKGEARVGENVPLVLKWFNPTSLTKNYRVVLVWFDEVGRSVTESVALPLNGLFPTWFWPSNQPVAYNQNVTLPSKPGRYRLGVALEDFATNQRTSVQKLDKPLEVR